MHGTTTSDNREVVGRKVVTKTRDTLRMLAKWRTEILQGISDLKVTKVHST